MRSLAIDIRRGKDDNAQSAPFRKIASAAADGEIEMRRVEETSNVVAQKKMSSLPSAA